MCVVTFQLAQREKHLPSVYLVRYVLLEGRLNFHLLSFSKPTNSFCFQESGNILTHSKIAKTFNPESSHFQGKIYTICIYDNRSKTPSAWTYKAAIMRVIVLVVFIVNQISYVHRVVSRNHILKWCGGRKPVADMEQQQSILTAGVIVISLDQHFPVSEY